MSPPLIHQQTCLQINKPPLPPTFLSIFHPPYPQPTFFPFFSRDSIYRYPPIRVVQGRKSSWNRSRRGRTHGADTDDIIHYPTHIIPSLATSFYFYSEDEWQWGNKREEAKDERQGSPQLTSKTLATLGDHESKRAMLREWRDESAEILPMLKTGTSTV